MRSRVVERVAGRSGGKETRDSAEAVTPKLRKGVPRFAIRLLMIAAGALGLRLISLAELHNTPLFEVLLGDARQYDAWARQVAAGNWIGAGTFYQAPLYPYLMSLVFAVAGHNLLAVRLLQCVFGATSCVLLGLAGRRFFNERVGLAAAGLLAVYPAAIFFDVIIQKSSLDCLLVTAILAALGAFLAGPRFRWLVAMGVALGLLMLNRENARLMYPILLVWLLIGFRAIALRARLAWVAVMSASAALVLAPVAIRNYSVGGEFFLSTSQLGPNLYIGNHANAPGTYEALIPDRGSVEFEQIDATELAEAALGRKLTPGEVSNYWVGQAFDYIRSHPLGWLGLMAHKVDLTFNAREAVDTESIEAYSEYSRVLRFLSWFSFGVVVPLGALGVWLTRTDWRRLAVLYAIVGGFALSVALFYVMARYRYPMTPVLLLFAASALTVIAAPRRISRASWASCAALALIVTVCSNHPASIPGDNTKVDLGSELVRMGRSSEAVPILRRAIAELPDYAPAHFSLALALGEVGEREEALKEYETTVRLWPEDFKAQGALALALEEGGRSEEALDHFREAARLQPDSTGAQNNLAVALDQAGKEAEAIPHYEAVIALKPDFAEAHSNLALALATVGRADEAMKHFAEALRLQPDNADMHMNFGNLLMDLRRTDDARSQYEQAVSLMPQSLDAQSRLAEAYMRESRFQDAIERFNAALTIARESGQGEAVQSLIGSIKTCRHRLDRRR